MNFEFSDEQQQLHDTVDRYLTDQYTFEKFRAINASAAGWDKTVWAGLGELGVLALNAPAAQGGLGFGPLETLSVLGVCGKSLLLEPFLSSAVIATAVLRACADDPAATDLMARMASGDAIAVLAHYEPESRFESQWVSSRAARSGDSYTLDGHKSVVMHAGAADTLLVSARVSGEPKDAKGISLFRVPHDAKGLKLDVYPTIDGQRAADVYLKGVELRAATRLGADGGALPMIEAALD